MTSAHEPTNPEHSKKRLKKAVDADDDDEHKTKE